VKIPLSTARFKSSSVYTIYLVRLIS
jgi:hypothetical protein